VLLAIVPSLLEYPRGRDKGRIRYVGTDSSQARRSQQRQRFCRSCGLSRQDHLACRQVKPLILYELDQIGTADL
jgi:hypothetical protein